eukprot:SAG31_NODE_43045_length_269_cov_0.470588_1_plen_41_part_10
MASREDGQVITFRAHLGLECTYIQIRVNHTHSYYVPLTKSL